MAAALVHDHSVLPVKMYSLENRNCCKKGCINERLGNQKCMWHAREIKRLETDAASIDDAFERAFDRRNAWLAVVLLSISSDSVAPILIEYIYKQVVKMVSLGDSNDLCQTKP